MRLLYGLISIGILLSGAISPATVGAAVTYPGENGALAFTKQGDDFSSIWRVNTDGTRKNRLVNHASGGVWSPSGRTLAYVSTKSHTLRTVKSNDDNSERLTTKHHVREHSPVWSPDGERIAFVREEVREKGKEPRSAIFSIKLNGRGETNVSGWSREANYASPSWSPEGDKMVYQKTSSDASELVIKNLKTSDVKQLVTLSDKVPANASWSPSGEAILFNDSSTEIYTIHPDGSSRTVLSDGESYLASWSPSGKRIAFLEHPSDESISISEEDGTVNQIPVQKGEYTEIGAPVWSPNGEKLTFILTNKTTEKSAIFTLKLNDKTHQLNKVIEGKLNDLSWQVKPRGR